ncbi:hypothetical protein [Duncaniella freteri]|jgi:hypothetical protein|uniref:hypothetical protein n=1 Tax=Duncaniella freteri TaxID=2530391 RepID=UPI0025583447|nr:hypothetical protein [Duncaniella freteri]
MEDIIIWIVIIAVGMAIEFLKKKKAEGDEDIQVTERKRQPRPASRPAPYRAPSVDNNDVTDNGTPRHPIHPKPAPAQSGNQAQPVRHNPFRSSYQPIAMSENMEAEISVEQPAATTAPSDEERDAHYARWRQAILDTQILERKF